MMPIDFPFRTDSRGRTAITDHDGYIRDLIEQVLLTAPGERVNRPDFGSGLLELVFAGNGGALASSTQLLVQGALQQWLGDLILVNAVEVAGEEATLKITVEYTVRRTQQRHVTEFGRGGA